MSILGVPVSKQEKDRVTREKNQQAQQAEEARIRQQYLQTIPSLLQQPVAPTSVQNRKKANKPSTFNDTFHTQGLGLGVLQALGTSSANK